MTLGGFYLLAHDAVSPFGASILKQSIVSNSIIHHIHHCRDSGTVGICRTGMRRPPGMP